MSALAFILQVLPVTGLALVVTFVGASVPVGDSVRVPLLLVGLLLFAGLLTFRRYKGRNLALLLGLALVVGALIKSELGAGDSPAWTGAAMLTIALMALAAFIGNALRGRLRRTGFIQWLLACVYLAGWGLGGLFDPPEWLRILWTSAGLVIFGSLAAVWFSQLKPEEIPPGGLAVGLGADLYLLGLSITVGAQVLLTSLATS
jgi:hypothetical protein